MIAGFKVCGVYPVNRQAVKPNDGTKNSKSDKQECSKRSENKFSETESAECDDRVSTEHEEIESTNCLQDEDDEITPELEKNFSCDSKRDMIYALIHCLLVGLKGIIQSQ